MLIFILLQSSDKRQKKRNPQQMRQIVKAATAATSQFAKNFENKELKRILEDLKNENKELKRILEDLKNENKELKRILEDLKNENKELRGSPCKNRPLEFLKITDFLQTFCVEEVIHKMNNKC
jgi:cell shape-determining protein MreC